MWIFLTRWLGRLPSPLLTETWFTNYWLDPTLNALQRRFNVELPD